MSTAHDSTHSTPHRADSPRTPGVLDLIEVTGIRAWGRHGVLSQEKDLGQQFVVDVRLHLSTAPAGRTDALARTVNYAEVAAAVHEEIGTGSYDLVEALAERIASRILTETGHPLVRRVDVTVHKPSAPVGLPVGDVAVTITRDAAPVDAVLALGTNLGDREAHLARALELLSTTDGIEVAWTGPVLETAPVGGPEGQGAFLNSVIGVSTVLGPFELLDAARRAERDAHRERLVRWGPRTLDVDVITYGTSLSDDEELTLPHPRAHERAFVLAPWHAARAEAALPGRGPVSDLLELAADRDGLRAGPTIPGFDRP